MRKESMKKVWIVTKLEAWNVNEGREWAFMNKEKAIQAVLDRMEEGIVKDNGIWIAVYHKNSKFAQFQIVGVPLFEDNENEKEVID